MTESSADQQPGSLTEHDEVPSDVLLARGLVIALGGTAGEVIIVETDTGVELSFPEADGSTAA